MTRTEVALFQFMPYGAPELREVARRYMVRATMVASATWLFVFMGSYGGTMFLQHVPKETSVIVVPYRELTAPPPLSRDAPPPQVMMATPIAPPTVGVAVPVPDAQAPPEQTIATQEEISAIIPGEESRPTGDKVIIVPPTEDELPKYGAYVYAEELPVVITTVQPQYPDIAREANVDGRVVVQALIGKDGRVKDTRVVVSVPMLDAAAVTAVQQYVFKPALNNNKPVAVWVAVPVKFTLH